MHDHSQCDHHKPASYNTAFAFGVTLNLAFVVAEVIYGFSAKSLALLADAGHNLGDVFGLLMGWAATYLATLPPTARRTYGYRRSSILAPLANSAMMLIAIGAIAWEAIQRLSEPVSVPGSTVMVVAAIGILVNGGTALMFLRGKKDDLNIEGAYLHMLTDAVVAAGVVCAGIAIKVTHHAWIDPVSSLVLVVLVGLGSWKLLKRSFDLALDSVPDSVDANAVRVFLESQVGVTAVTDLHIWGMSTTEIALTAHIVIPSGGPPELASDIAHEIYHEFGIGHCTIQVDHQPAACSLAV